MMSDDAIIRIILAVVVLAGVLQVIYPEWAWWIEHGMPKDVEPSGAGVLFTRIGGVICAIIGIIIFFTTFN